jgi:hypothetical protein
MQEAHFCLRGIADPEPDQCESRPDAWGASASSRPNLRPAADDPTFVKWGRTNSVLATYMIRCSLHDPPQPSFSDIAETSS